MPGVRSLAGWVGFGVSASLHAAVGVWLAHTDVTPAPAPPDDVQWTLALPPAQSFDPPSDRPPQPPTPTEPTPAEPTPPPPAAATPTQPVTPRPPVVVQKLESAIEDVRLGVEASRADDGAWLGGPEAREHRATLSEVNQPALTTQEAGTPNPAATTGTPGPIRPAPSPSPDPRPQQATPSESPPTPSADAAQSTPSPETAPTTASTTGPNLPAPPTTPDPSASDRKPEPAPAEPTQTPSPTEPPARTELSETLPDAVPEGDRNQPEPPAARQEAVSIDPFGTLVMATPTAGVLTLRLPPGVSMEDLMRAPLPPESPTPIQPAVSQPEPTPPRPAEDASASGGATGGPTAGSGGRPGERSTKESPATSTVEASDYRPGMPLAANGLEINTVAPVLTDLSLLTFRPQNPEVELTFRDDGTVRAVRFIRSAGRKDWDDPVRQALFRWTISPASLDRLRRERPGEALPAVRIRILLSRS